MIIPIPTDTIEAHIRNIYHELHAVNTNDKDIKVALKTCMPDFVAIIEAYNSLPPFVMNPMALFRENIKKEIERTNSTIEKRLSFVLMHLYSGLHDVIDSANPTFRYGIVLINVPIIVEYINASRN